MTDKKRISATSRIGDPAENRLRESGYELEVFQGPEAKHTIYSNSSSALT